MNATFLLVSLALQTTAKHAEMTASQSEQEMATDTKGVLNHSAQTLFLSELTRGMSINLKYFFDTKITVRAFSAPSSAFSSDWSMHLSLRLLRSTTPSRRDPSALASVASTPSADTPPARSAASLVSSAKPSVLHKPSPSKRRSERMAAARPPDTTLCAHRSCATALLQRYSNLRPNPFASSSHRT